jgi:N-acetylglucosaminyldiphosphoundecaprenol N-acetyl-beta-D-mannosaminyltransferase
MSHPRVNILGVGISAINMDEALASIEEAIDSRGKGYVCVSNVHSIMEAYDDPSFRTVLNRAFLTTPDGMPTVWLGWANGFKTMDRVYGPELMLRTCELSVQKGYTHFLYGGNPGVAEELRQSLMARFPGIKIVGTYTPPFRPLNLDEEAALIRMVSEKKPDIFWVGLSTPKQDRFMAAYVEKLDVRLMFGVGAAFDFHTGHTKDSPEWIKRSGLQWLHRFFQEPRRLWKRYLLHNPRFVVLALLQLLKFREYRQKP